MNTGDDVFAISGVFVAIAVEELVDEDEDVLASVEVFEALSGDEFGSVYEDVLPAVDDFVVGALDEFIKSDVIVVFGVEESVAFGVGVDIFASSGWEVD